MRDSNRRVGEQRSGEREGPFTRYLRGTLEEADPAVELIEEMWGWMRGMLVAELRRKSLFHQNPRYLGFDGYDAWTGGTAVGVGRDDALDELAREAYVLLFGRKLPSLVKTLRALDEQRQGAGETRYRDLDGMARRHLRNLVFGRQKAFDRLGYRAYEVVSRVIRSLEERGRLRRAPAGIGMHNDTLISLCGAGPGPETSGEDLRGLLPWAGPVMFWAIVGAGRRSHNERKALEGHLLELAAQGVRRFRFGDLLQPLKAAARSLASSAFEEAVPGPSEGLSLPQLSVEARQHFERMAECIGRSVEALEPGPRRDRLTRLWNFFHLHATEEFQPRQLSANRLATALEIPRNLIPDLRETLAEMYLRCQEALFGRAPAELRDLRRDLALGGGQGYA